MNDALRRAEMHTVGRSPYEIPSYPYVWFADRGRRTIRLEMGLTEEAVPKRIVAMFHMEPRAPPAGVGVLVHIVVWFMPTEGSDPELQPHYSANTNYHLTAMKHFKGSLLLVRTDYAVAVPSDMPDIVDSPKL